MTELTKEQLIEEAKLKIAIAKCHPNSEMAQVEGELFKIALASLEAEPIAWKCGENIILFNPDTVEAYAKRAEITPEPLFAAPPVPVVPEGLVKAVCFYEQVKRENPPAETGAWKDAVDWVLKEACCAAILGKADNPLASGNQVSELTMLVKQLVSQLKKVKPDCKLPGKVMDYLKRNGLISAEDILL
ncbi:hypothetical protein ED737_19450 [Escherichia coli]|uniref:hypothetical protein n=1 Tax=Escherichia coli TaxID=562 RepID=UPI000FA0A66C|nr:hypothetical protein [Escherichia coli]EEV5998685.1 hypothetical protein [Escherichia coli]EFC3660150.1 hypothetical protein [Escherichia coli]EFN6004069.1 hypothetical protein [Escherichia coli]MFA79363.1 hypothetical protein [Escherichia coli]GDG34874.1 hypothetical protein BvCmsKKNP017_03255 [Escherichia coli]